MTSSVASSAQWRSSITAIVGEDSRSSSTSATKTACGFSLGAGRGQHIASRHRRDVGQRTQGPWRLERIARAPEHACARMVRVAEVPHQSALADSGLARDQHEATAAFLHGGQAASRASANSARSSRADPASARSRA